jgi:phospholipid-binding lipoprotein MlaA
MVFGDRYLFYRDAYLQRREFLANDGQVQDGFDNF